MALATYGMDDMLVFGNVIIMKIGTDSDRKISIEKSCRRMTRTIHLHVVDKRRKV